MCILRNLPSDRGGRTGVQSANEEEDSRMNGKKALGFVVAAAVVGMLAGGHNFAGEGKKDAGKTVKCAGVNSCKGHGECASADGSHACAGKNECKGKGGCATASAKHECKGKNECKSLGGCKSGDAGCAGKNSCKGKGGCAVPVKHE